MKTIFFVTGIYSALLLGLHCHGVEPPPTAAAPSLTTAASLSNDIPVKGYALAWSDEFNGSSLDASKWGHRALGPRRDATNAEECASLDGKGNLLLTTKRKGGNYLTAMISTQGKFEAKYGYFECRAQLQKQLGHWSAFWLQSPSIGSIIGNPRQSGTEIDIFEYLRKERDVLHHNLHWDGYQKNHQHVGGRAKVPGLSSGWHTFGVLWTESQYVFYVDGKATWKSQKAVSQRSQYIILSLEVGKWAGEISKAKLPDHLIVDYVRVYQKR